MMQKFTFLVCLLFLTLCCTNDDSSEGYAPTPASISIPGVFLQLLPAPEIPANNPLTEEGIALGRQLFF